MGSSPTRAGWELLEPQLRPIHEDVLARLAVGLGTQVLDVACGAGGFAGLAALRGARVTLVDDSSALLELAHERLPAAELHRAGVEELPLAAESFDVVVGFDAFQYAEHPVRALAQARRVARPGAHVVLGSWGSDQACAAAACLHALAPPRSGASGPHDDGEFETLALHAGLAPGAIVEVSCPWSFPDLATALRALSSWRPVAAAARATGERQVRERLGFALARFRGAGAGYRMENRFRYLVASA